MAATFPLRQAGIAVPLRAGPRPAPAALAAPDELGHALHQHAQPLLALAPRALRSALLRDVVGRAEPFQDLAVGVEDRDRARMGPADRTVGADHAMFEIENTGGRDRVADHRLDLQPVLRRYIGVDPSVAGPIGVGQEAAAEQLAHLAPVGVHAVEDLTAGADQRAELLFRQAGAQPRGDIHERRHHALDPVLHGAVGADAHGIDTVAGGGHLALQGHERAHHVARLVHHRRVLQSVGEVGERAADIEARDVEQLGDRRREHLDAQVRIEEQRADIGRGGEVLEVAVRGGQVLQLALQLGVDGVQLLVDRLELLAAGLQLLGGGAVFLVGGLQLLVGRA